METNLPCCFLIQFLEQLLKFLVNFTLLKYLKSERSYGFLITKELIFGFQILNLRDNDHFSASLRKPISGQGNLLIVCCRMVQMRYKVSDDLYCNRTLSNAREWTGFHKGNYDHDNDQF